MVKFNPKGTDGRKDYKAIPLAGGLGAVPAKQDAEALLRRAVMACLLWEDMAYEGGGANAGNIEALVPQVDADKVAEIAIEAREKQKLRHVPLWLAVQMLKYTEHKKNAREVIRSVCTRADQLTDLVALYWKAGKRPLPRQMKAGLADAFERFNAYQLAKYDRDGAVKLRDVMRLCHAKPPRGKEELYKHVNERTLPTPDTWEVALSGGADKKATWERLIAERKIGNLAFLRNLRNMLAADVAPAIIREGLQGITDAGLLPLNFLAALKYAPRFAAEIEEAMLRVYAKRDKLPGHTAFAVDVSGSMRAAISAKSELDRIDAASAMAALLRETGETVTIYATAGNYSGAQTSAIRNYRGFGIVDQIREAARRLGGGGIFTRQCLEYMRQDLRGESVDRVIIFSDSQDCDRGGGLPAPFGRNNYIVDVSAHKHGVNYAGLWTAEVSGWSEYFLTFISAMEGVGVAESGD